MSCRVNRTGTVTVYQIAPHEIGEPSSARAVPLEAEFVLHYLEVIGTLLR